MGKTVENELNRITVQDTEDQKQISDEDLPIPLPDEKKLYQMFSGKFIGIIDGQIVAVDSSLRNLQLKVKQIIPEGKECTIEFFEDGVSIYGVDF